jgi:hypothetical protein
MDGRLLCLPCYRTRWLLLPSSSIIPRLRELLEYLEGDPTTQQSRFFRGLQPYPEGWRASLPRPEVLPHYPMVLHRGGFPGGA